MTKFDISTLICMICNRRMFIPRKQKQKTNHIKNMYCYSCKKETKFKEIGEYK